MRNAKLRKSLSKEDLSDYQVLKDWTKITNDTNIFSGTSLEFDSVNNTVLEIKNLSVQGDVSLRFTKSGGGNPSNQFGDKSYLKAVSSVNNATINNKDGYLICKQMLTGYPIYGSIRVDLLEITSGGNLPEGMCIMGYHAEAMVMMAEFSNRQIYKTLTSATFSDTGGKLEELWLGFINQQDGIEPQLEYRIIRK